MKFSKLSFLLAASFAAIFSLTNCKHQAAATAPDSYRDASDNTLSKAEKAAGWKLLFDGKTMNGWHRYGTQTCGKNWMAENGAIHLDASKKAGWQAADGGDILTADNYENFELQLEWKIAQCGNSGIIYHVQEDLAKYDFPWKTGPEMQVLDNTCHADSKIRKHRAGDLYDLVESSKETVKPAGQWNQVRLVSRNGHVEHWLNGTKVVEIQMFENGKPTAKWLELIKGSKFPPLSADFGLSMRGKICLQDHGDNVWFKNVKIKSAQ